MIWSLIFFMTSALFAKPIIVGSKSFTESVILGEMAKLAFIHKGVKAEHKAELGGTSILWGALESGDIDIYPEYTGTIEEEFLRKKTTEEQMKTLLSQRGIGISKPLGFNNTYAIGMKRKKAQKLGIKTISDLRNHPRLKISWSAEFRERQDGWPGLKKTYQLPFKNIRGLDHDVAYRALESGELDVVDLYSTDAEIKYYDLTILEDDLNFFPRYDAVYLYRLEKEKIILPILVSLSGKISEDKMVSMNVSAKIEKKSPTEIAASFLNSLFSVEMNFQVKDRSERIFQRTLEHLNLVSVSLFFAILFAIPIGILAAKSHLMGKIVLMTVSAVQTIPALALLVLMIKPLTMIGLSGIGDTPAYIALFLYSLLPIVRNTHSGIKEIPLNLQETSTVLELPFFMRLLRIELPLALPSILAGIKTALVMNVGFATLGALVGAGGFGQSILTGIRLDDYGLIMEGAIPAAMMALVVQQLFDYLENNLRSQRARN